MYFNIVEYFVTSAIIFVFLFAQNSLLRLQFAFLNILYNHKPNARYFHPPGQCKSKNCFRLSIPLDAHTVVRIGSKIGTYVVVCAMTNLESSVYLKSIAFQM